MVWMHGQWSLPDLPFLTFLNFWKSSKSNLLFFGRFSQLTAFSVSAVASGWFFAVAVQFFNSKAVRRGLGRPKLMCKQNILKCFSKKIYLSTLCGPQISQTYPLLVCFRYKLLMESAYSAIRWQSWQTWFKTENLTNIPPPGRGGLSDSSGTLGSQSVEVEDISVRLGGLVSFPDWYVGSSKMLEEHGWVRGFTWMPMGALWLW